MSGSDDTLSLVLFSGTDDKLSAAAVLAVGAVAMGRSVNVFLMGLTREDLIDGLEKPAGATTALLEAQDAVTLFI